MVQQFRKQKRTNQPTDQPLAINITSHLIDGFRFLPRMVTLIYSLVSVVKTETEEHGRVVHNRLPDSVQTQDSSA